VLVVHDGQVIAERYARGVGADTPLPGWSMAKSVLNALVGILVADGRLAVSQRELLREWRSPDPRSAISLEDLLRMRSGLQFSEAYGNPWSDVLHMLFNCPDAAGYAASRPLVNPPGRVWAYASGTSNIVSAIVRDTVGASAYPEWPRRVLFEPLQMESAILEPDEAGTFVCSSYMLATARDWARYGQLWLDGGRRSGRALLPPDWVRLSTAPTPESPQGRYGAHWWLKLNPEVGGNDPAAASIAPDAFFAIGHEGQTLTIIPSRRLVVVRLGAAIYIDAWNHARFIAELQDAAP
jgi:CubicO group peptidase (beta-lactamase class C family)